MKKLCLILAAWACFWTGSIGQAGAGDRPEQYVVTVKTYIISGSPGAGGLSFPIFPHMSMAVLEETISDIETFYVKLKSLYAFSEYRLLTVASTNVRLVGYPNPEITYLSKGERGRAGQWKVVIQDFNWDLEGRLQMLVQVEKDGEPFLESHISVLPERSVILGRFADQVMGEAIFAIIVPIIEVAAVPEKDSPRFLHQELGSTRSGTKKTGLPPPEPRLDQPLLPFGSDEDKVELDLAVAEELPEIIEQYPPKYPESAQRDGAEGNVWVRSLISEEGKVIECYILRSSGRDDLDQAGLEAAGKFVYRAGKDAEGNEIKVWVAFQIVFKFDK